MNIQLNPLADYLVENIYNDSAPYVRSQYKKLIAERDTSDVWRQFAIWLLVDPDHGVIRFTKYDSKQYRSIRHVTRLYDENCKDRNAWDKATRHTHRAAACAAWADRAAASAAYYAAYYATADTAWSAYAAAHAAALAADAAAWDIAGNSAAWADANAGAWSAAEAAARSAAAAAAHVAAHNRMAEKLLELLQLAPTKEAP